MAAQAMENRHPSSQALELSGHIDRLRPQSRFALETFLRAAELGMGGSLTIVAPTKSGGLPEARYVPAGISITVASANLLAD